MPRHSLRSSGCFSQPRLHRLVQLVRRQTGQRVEIDRKRDRHADAGRREAVMPAELFAERAADQRREKRADIDADVEDRIGAVAARVAGRIEPADLRRDVGLERAVAENEHGQGEQEQRLERHHEMADRHQRRAEQDGAMLAEHAVGEDAAEQGREIDEAGIEPVDVRGERLRAERPEHRFVQAPQSAEADHILGVLGQQQIFHHVEHEQRAHPVIGEALPHLGREQEGQPARVAEEVGLAVRRARAWVGSRKGHDGILLPFAASRARTTLADLRRLLCGSADPRTRGGLPSNLGLGSCLRQPDRRASLAALLHLTSPAI